MSSNDDLMRALGRIEAKLDAINARQQEIKEDVEDIETQQYAEQLMPIGESNI